MICFELRAASLLTAVRGCLACLDLVGCFRCLSPVRAAEPAHDCGHPSLRLMRTRQCLGADQISELRSLAARSCQVF